MRKPAITLGGTLLAIWGAVQVYTALAGAYADGADFNKYVADLVCGAMSSLSIGVIVLLAGVGLVLFGLFGDRIRWLLWRKRRRPEGAAPATSQERAAKEAHAGTRKVDDLVAADSGKVYFDYSTHDGLIAVGVGDREFWLRFIKSSDIDIYLHKDNTNLSGIARIKGARTGDQIDFADHDSSSRSYTIRTGEHFIAANDKGYFLQGRVKNIRDCDRAPGSDEVQFDYQIGEVGQSRFRAL